MRKSVIVLIVVIIVSATLLTLNFTQPKPIIVRSLQSNVPIGGGYVDVTIKNNGATGKVVVTVQAFQVEKHWTQSQTINIKAGESVDLGFNFPEIDYYYSPWTYTVKI